MKFGASSFIWASPFSNQTLDLIDKAKRIGFDLFEVCVEDPATIDTAAINRRAEQTGAGILVCGAFGPNRDISADDAATRDQGVAYIKTCVDFAAELGSPVVVGPMYSAVGKCRLLSPEEREAQRVLAVDNMKKVADYAGERNVRLGVEPLNRFETDFLNTVEQGLEFFDRIGRDNVGFLLDTFHMNIEEQDLPAAIRRASGRIVHFHACANDRGTPGKDTFNWPSIVGALKSTGYDGAVVIESFTPEIKEIARAVSIWRPLASSQDALATDGLAHLKRVFA